MAWWVIWNSPDLLTSSPKAQHVLGRKQKEEPEKEILCKYLIHEVDPQSRPVVITISARVVCPYVRSCPHFSKSRKTKQLSSDNSGRYWRDCVSGQVDHWRHTCLVFGCFKFHIQQIEIAWTFFCETSCCTCNLSFFFAWENYTLHKCTIFFLLFLLVTKTTIWDGNLF